MIKPLDKTCNSDTLAAWQKLNDLLPDVCDLNEYNNFSAETIKVLDRIVAIISVKKEETPTSEYTSQRIHLSDLVTEFSSIFTSFETLQPTCTWEEEVGLYGPDDEPLDREWLLFWNGEE